MTAADNTDPSLAQALAPTGVLRASINLGNPILAASDAGTGKISGVSVDLARAFAQTLGLEVELLVFDSARESVDAVTNEQADIGFFAIDPLRGAGIAFTAPYVLIEGAYMVAENSPIRGNDQVDQPGIRIVVGKGSAYDLFLTREIKQAELVRAPTSPTVVSTFQEQKADVAAGVKQQLEMDAQRLGGLRLLPERFMVIRQAMGCPIGRPPHAARYLADFVDRINASGFVADALQRHGIKGASPAGNAG